MAPSNPSRQLLARIAAWPPRILLPLAAAAGVLAALGFAPDANVAAPVLGFALLILLLAGGRWPFLTGLVFGFGHFMAGLRWIATAFTFQAAMPPWMGWVAVAGLSLYLALFVALACWGARRLSGRIVPLGLLLAGLFMFMELLRGWLFTGFPWNPLGAPWLQLDGVAAFAAIIGATGLSGLMILAAASLAALVGARDESGRWPMVAVFPLLLCIGLLVPQARAPLPEPTGPRLLLVQPNISQAEKNSFANIDADISRQIALLRAGIAQHPDTRAVVWPEAAVQYPLNDEPGLAQAITRALPPGALLLTGSIAIERDTNGTAIGARNSLYALDHLGRTLMRYDKAHLVPGGEYLPLRVIAEPLGLTRLVPGDFDFLPGPGPATFHVPGLPAFGPAICYEIIFGGAIIDRADRPEWILTVSNDAWFGPSGPPQHHAQARLRAIEEGLPLVRVTPTGISSLIGPHGEELHLLESGVVAMAAVRLPDALAPTPFARLGSWSPMLFALLLLAGGLALKHRKT